MHVICSLFVWFKTYLLVIADMKIRLQLNCMYVLYICYKMGLIKSFLLWFLTKMTLEQAHKWHF